MNRLLRFPGACSLAAMLLAVLAADSSAQTWTSRAGSSSSTSDVVNTSGTSNDDGPGGPSLGNTQSQWTPRFQAPRGGVSKVQHTEPESAVVDEPAVNPDNTDAPTPEIATVRTMTRSQQYRQRSRILPASMGYTPDWQRSPRMARAGQFSNAGYPAGGGPNSRLAQAMPPGGKGSPFVEDEIVPQGTRTPAPGPVPDADVQFQNQPAFDGIADGAMVDGDGCGGPCGPPGPCFDDGCCFDDFCCGGCDPMAFERFGACCPWAILNQLSFTGGVQTFKAPVDNGRNANFGLVAGVNAGDSLWHAYGIGYQVGAQVIESDFYGDQASGAYMSANRRQVFVTAGLFHRAFYNWGWQGGAVIDYLNDQYYYDTTFTQVRGELSYVFGGGHEVGSWIAAHTSNQNFFFTRSNQTLTPLNLYTFFYRRTFYNGTQGRVWAGFTDPVFIGGTNSNASAIFGADFRIVLSNRWDFMGVMNYLPSTQGQSSGQQVESWAMGMNLVFYPARYARGIHNGPYRPLFNVADNSNFILARKP